MKEFNWSLLKSERLKRTRGVSFEEVIQGKLVAVREHPKKQHQRIILFEFKGYVWVVPFVETAHEFFLKTLYPSRKFTKIYKRGEL